MWSVWFYIFVIINDVELGVRSCRFPDLYFPRLTCSLFIVIRFGELEWFIEKDLLEYSRVSYSYVSLNLCHY